MRILLNGEPAETADQATLSELLLGLRLGAQRIAVELNGEIVPRSRWSEVCLREGDRAEVVRAVGGG